MKRIIGRNFSRSFRPSVLPPSQPNYNFEENQKYSEKYQAAVTQRELLVKKLSVDNSGPVTPPSRRRIVKEVNYSLKGYLAWRRFDIQLSCVTEKSDFKLEITGKLQASAYDLVQTFGYPTHPGTSIEDSFLLFSFMDNNLDIFHLYDHTNRYKEMLKANKNDMNRTFKEILASKELVDFRFTGSQYCEKHRFSNFIKDGVQRFKSGKLVSFDERARAQFGEIERYEDFDKEYTLDKSPAVFKWRRSELDPSNAKALEFIQDSELDETIKPALDIRTNAQTKKL